jgi:hypothetical protein
LFALVPLFALGVACKDDGPGAFADMATNWQIFCTSGGVCTFQPHEQTDDVEFDVQCQRDGGSLRIILKAKPDPVTMTPGGTLDISRIDPATNSCVVTVTDAQKLGDNALTLSDSCTGSLPTGGCVISGGKASGWDFAGTLSCSKMTQAADPTRIFRLGGKGAQTAVNLQIDCG